MINTGKMNILTVGRFTPQGAYLSDDEGMEVLLPNRYLTDEIVVGTSLSVFVYRDSDDRIVATTETPAAFVDQFACLEVKDSTSIGAFLDWGLPKDLLLPYRQMIHPVSKGKKYVVRVLLDDVTDRIVATTKLRPFFEPTDPTLSRGDKVDAMIYKKTESGYLAVVNGKMSGIISLSEFTKRVGIGFCFQAYISKISEDNRIVLSLSPSTHENREEIKSVILEKIKESGGKLHLNDKSDPAEIKRVTGLSKKAFKKLIGNLKKDKKILITDSGIELV